MRMARFALLVLIAASVFVSDGGVAAADVPKPLAVAARVYAKNGSDGTIVATINNIIYVFNTPDDAKSYYNILVTRSALSSSTMDVTRQSVMKINEGSAGYTYITSPDNNKGAAVIILDHYFVFTIDTEHTPNSSKAPPSDDLADVSKLAQAAFGKPRQPAKNTQAIIASNSSGVPDLAPLDLALRFDEVPPGYQLYSEEVRVPVPDAIASDK